jgi:hypothetical protein
MVYVYGVLCKVYGMVYGIWYMVYGVWSIGVRCMVNSICSAPTATAGICTEWMARCLILHIASGNVSRFDLADALIRYKRAARPVPPAVLYSRAKLARG